MNYSMSRPDWDNYFLTIAKDVSARGTCLRKKVGYVAVKDNRILTTGYNGSMPGLPHCSDVGCYIEKDSNGFSHCIRTIHAEVNCIAQASKFGINLSGATLYGTFGPPCWSCFKVVAGAGIKRIVYIEGTTEAHQNKLVVDTSRQASITLEQIVLTDEKASKTLDKIDGEIVGISESDGMLSVVNTPFVDPNEMRLIHKACGRILVGSKGALDHIKSCSLASKI